MVNGVIKLNLVIKTRITKTKNPNKVVAFDERAWGILGRFERESLNFRK